METGDYRKVYFMNSIDGSEQHKTIIEWETEASNDFTRRPCLFQVA